jgi:hypothetical protein
VARSPRAGWRGPGVRSTSSPRRAAAGRAVSTRAAGTSHHASVIRGSSTRSTPAFAARLTTSSIPSPSRCNGCCGMPIRRGADPLPGGRRAGAARPPRQAADERAGGESRRVHSTADERRLRRRGAPRGRGARVAAGDQGVRRSRRRCDAHLRVRRIRAQGGATTARPRALAIRAGVRSGSDTARGRVVRAWAHAAVLRGRQDGAVSGAHRAGGGADVRRRSCAVDAYHALPRPPI